MEKILKRCHIIRKSKGPLKRVYKLYETDTSIPVPKRTFFRQQSDPSSTNNDDDSEPDGGSPGENFNPTEDNSTSSHSSLSSKSETSVVNDNNSTSSHSSLSSDADTSVVNDNVSTSSHWDLSFDSDTSVMNDNISTSSHSALSSDSDTSIMNEDDNASPLSSEDETLPEDYGDIGASYDTLLHKYCVLAYAKRFNLSSEATGALKNLASILSPDTNFKHCSGKMDLRSFHYCEKCQTVFPENNPDSFECSECHGLRYEGDQNFQQKYNRKPRCEFIIANIEQQLKHILEKPGMALHQQGDSVIHDIIDGSCYKELCEEGKFLSEESNLSAIMNTDGVPLYFLSKVKLWPIFLAINEIPPLHRFARDNLIVAGMWQGKSTPTPFQHYMSYFANEMNKLSIDGTFICPPNSNRTNVKLSVLLATLDLQAKAYISNMSMHNGEMDALHVKNQVLQQRKGKAIYPYWSEKPPARTSDAVNAAAQQATRRVRVKGICGKSGLSRLHGFDIVCGLVPDYMHGILLGVTKALLKLWFSKSSSGFDFYIGKHIKNVSLRLQNMTPPDSIERLQRDFEINYEHFKATELQVWLLYYGLPCLKNVLAEQYLQHFFLLSEGTFLLLGDSITRTELDRAGLLLDKFYKVASALYGPGSCGLNIHNVGIHVAQFVSYWGPIWCWSCFPFEDCNAAVLQTVHGTGSVTRQYLHIKQQHQQLNELGQKSVNDVVCCKKAQRFLNSMLKSSRKGLGESFSANVCKVVGSLVKVSNDECSNELLGVTESNNVSDLRKFLRVEMLDQMYYSQEYSRMQRRKSKFAVLTAHEVAQNCYISEGSGRHIIKIIQTEQQNVISVSRIMDKLFYMAVDNDRFVSRLPNAHGR
ncbi:LOW QUALITY PROTEIN: hypothetical protein MAR_022837, partial [Mya arenaria]